MSWVYGIQSGLFIKVGISRDIPARLEQMNLYNPHPCKVVLRRRVRYPRWVETRMHEVLKPYAIGREWFMVDVKLVRAVATVVIKEMEAMHIDQLKWEAESARKAEDRTATRGRNVENENEKIIPLKKQAKT